MTVVFALVVASVVGFAALHSRPEPEPGPSRFGPARLLAKEAEARACVAGPCWMCVLERQVRIDAGYRRLAEDVWGDET